ncbi:MAG: hypothetical protein FJ308_00615 [Planctomycetes bacterium]|nr:hypothetical protein [Planctomycetota bacterium]
MPWISFFVAWFFFVVGGQLSPELLRGTLAWNSTGWNCDDLIGSVGGNACWASSEVGNPGCEGYSSDEDGGWGEDGSSTRGVEEIPVYQALVCDGVGVGYVLIPAGQIAADATVRILVHEANDRILYPAVEILSIDPEPGPQEDRRGGFRPGSGSLLKRFKDALERVREHINPPEYVRVHFLFIGAEPLQITLAGEIERVVSVTPVVVEPKEAAIRFRVPLQEWWAGMLQYCQRQIDRSDYPTLIERYLVNMLGARLGFEVPELIKAKSKPASKQTDPLPTMSLIAGVESLRDQLRQEQLSQGISPGQANVPIPSPPRWKDAPLPDSFDGKSMDAIPVEPISSVVPPECLYIRFGSFANYLWFQQLSQSRGGDIAQMALLRGFNYETNQRAERMLNTKMNYISKLFGDAVILDMAFIGYDLYLQEGPTMGVVFEARNLDLLRSSFQQEREATRQRLADQGCKLQTIEIEGSPVSFLSTPDNQVRSFVVEAAPYLFVTTSQELAKRFIEVQKSKESLASLPAFRFARLMMPIENKYDVFAYFSSPFFRNLISPHYQIELRRRLRATAAIETIETATMVAASEKKHGFRIPTTWSQPDRKVRPANGFESVVAQRDESGDRWPSVDQMIEQNYLPGWFHVRADGSQTIRMEDSWVDSVRGRRGSFLPIADVPLVDCTVSEAAEYRAASEFYSRQWEQTDPLMFGLRRYSHPDIPKAERIAIEGYIAPFGSDKYGWVGLLLAPPLDTQVQLPEDDVINLQFRLRGIQDRRNSVPDHFVFAGLKDLMPPLPEETKGLIATLRVLKSLPAYVGAWPKPAVLDQLPLGLGGGPPDLMGFSRSILGLWRWQMGGFSILSFDRSILETCAMAIKIAPADDFAQARATIRDLSKSKLSGWFNTFSFRQAAQTTRGNLLLLDSVQQQLGIEPEIAKDRVEQLLDAKIQCALGGEYRLEKGRWISTAWPEKLELAPGAEHSMIGYDTLHTIPPKEYVAPWLEWFRGAQVHLTQLPERLVVIGHLDMEPLPVSTKGNGGDQTETTALPKLNFDIYNLPFQMFNSDKPKKGQDSNNGSKPSESDSKSKRAPKKPDATEPNQRRF